VQQIREVDAVEYPVDLLLQHDPDGANAAGVRRRATFFLDWVRYAMKIERLQLRRRNHIAHRNGLGPSGERVSAMRAASTFHDARATKANENLLDVIHWQPLA
jgi:hypothetical protein